MQVWTRFKIILHLLWMVIIYGAVKITVTKPKMFAPPSMSLHFLLIINYLIPLTLLSHISAISSLIALRFNATVLFYKFPGPRLSII